MDQERSYLGGISQIISFLHYDFCFISASEPFQKAADDLVQAFRMDDMFFCENNFPKFLHIELAKYISFHISSAWNFIFS